MDTSSINSLHAPVSRSGDPSVITIDFEDGVYVGSFIVQEGETIAHGRGKYSYASGDVYEGDFDEDELHGQGTYTWADGTRFSGGWVRGVQEGYGVLQDASTGEVYTGEWRSDARHGIGRSVFANGSIYEGGWANNLRQGMGILSFPDGSYYDGHWLSNERHGKGKQIYSGDTGSYDGDWVKSMREGFGAQTFASGDSFVGHYKTDVFHGEGKYTWADGRRFEGMFEKGHRHGKGCEFTTSGDVYVGTWLNGVTTNDVVFEPNALRASLDTDVAKAIRQAIAAIDDVETVLPPIVWSPSAGSKNGALTNPSPAGSPSPSRVYPSTTAEVGSPKINSGGMYTSEQITLVLANISDDIKSSIMVSASIRPKEAPPANTEQLVALLTGADLFLQGASSSAGTSSSSPVRQQQNSLESDVFSSTGRGISMADLERYTPMNLLGRGSFGAAYEAVLPTGRTVCVKVMELASMTDPAALASLHNEIALMQRLHHPNVVDFYGCTRNEKKHTLNIFMEYITGGSLVTYAKKFKFIPDPTVRRWAYQMVCGVKYLHDHNVIHRDIKGDNILMTNDGVIKLADFGCSKAIDGVDSRTQGCSTMVGTPYWMAPEVIMCSKDQTGSYGTKADIWSVGCTIIEMITGKPPWPECSSVWRAIYQIANATGPPELPDRIQGQLRDFLLAIFERDPAKRPSADDLLKHPYLAGYNGY